MRLSTIPRGWVLLTAMGALLATGCTDEGESLSTGPDVQALRIGPLSQEVNLGPALAAQARHTEALMRLDGVVGTGVGLDENGEPAIKVFTLTAGVRGIPDHVDGVPVRRVVTGMFVADDTTDPTRPAPNGFSIGHPDITAGTLGAIVGDGTTCYILSNNHVLANQNEALIGDPSLQPGPFDGGTAADAIGSLHAFKPISFNSGTNDIDAAISTIFFTADVTAATPSNAYGAPGATLVAAFVGQSVQKFGRTTEHTIGEVAAINATVDVCYQTQGPFRCKKLARFTGQFVVTPGTFSGGGDSGSLIVANAVVASPVGLLFAGSSSHTIANPIENVLTYFGVTIQPDLTNCGSGEAATNSPPTADFTFTTTDLKATFTDASTDSDGSVDAWAWDFGDSNTSTDQDPSHTYAAGGTYTVTLTVTDDDDDTDAKSQVVDVSVSEPASGDIELLATGYKVRGLPKADLTWSDASGDDLQFNVDVFRNETEIETGYDGSSYTDNIDIRGGGSYTYQVCEAGTSTCSNEAVVTF